MTWTDNIYNLVDSITKEIYKNLDRPHGKNCVIRTAYKKMTLQDCYAVVRHFQQKGFEATWYQKDDKNPIIIVSWGIPYGIDEIDDMYKAGIKIAGDDDNVITLLAEYVHNVYVGSYKSICVIPMEHFDYICGDRLSYKIFVNALREAEEYYSLKICTGTLDQEDWETEYICIQEKDKKIK